MDGLGEHVIVRVEDALQRRRRRRELLGGRVAAAWLLSPRSALLERGLVAEGGVGREAGEASDEADDGDDSNLEVASKMRAAR